MMDTLTEVRSWQPNHAVILDSLPQAILIVDDSLVVHYANSAAETVFKSSSGFLHKHPLTRLVPFGSPVITLVERVFSNSGPVRENQIDISSPRTGTGKIVDVHGSPLEDQTGFVLLVFRERGMAERIGQQLNNRSAAKSVTGLASMLAHEIKNPLSGIRGAAQLLETIVSGDDAELTRLITSETDRIVKLVDQMEVFSDDTPHERKAVNMHSVLGHVRKIAQNGFAADIEIIEKYDPSLPDVPGSKDQLVQVFLNLVKNAAEATKVSKTKKIILSSAYRPGIHVKSPGTKETAALPLEFSVIDTGGGIPDEIRGHIFEPFVTTRVNGTGLGLALVAKIIGQHGGVIECESGSNGTVMRVFMPAWNSDTKAVKIEDKQGG